MKGDLDGNLIVSQGGGPTAVINASLMGVIKEAKEHSCIKGIYGAVHGIRGLFEENIIDLSKKDDKVINNLQYTPGAALGSCRLKLDDKDYPMLISFFKKYDIRYFLYIGGNDSMDSCNKISKLAKKENYDMKVIGVPKTIDNDLNITDHCPGFGSAARYYAISAMELSKDVEALNIHVVVMEIMGRNAGWLTAASSLAKRNDGDGPHLVYVPERAFIEEQFLGDVEKIYKKQGYALITVSEGIKRPDGSPLADSGIIDGFGHKVPGGVAQALSDILIKKAGIKSRSEKPGLLGRASIMLQSSTDRQEAAEIGEYAVKKAVDGNTGYMVGIERLAGTSYKYKLQLIPLEKAANVEKVIPDKYINERGNGITDAFRDYCLPLIGEPLPDYSWFI